jgi:hypothetical protein
LAHLSVPNIVEASEAVGGAHENPVVVNSDARDPVPWFLQRLDRGRVGLGTEIPDFNAIVLRPGDG